jgi:hypothetical protein
MNSDLLISCLCATYEYNCSGIGLEEKKLKFTVSFNWHLIESFYASVNDGLRDRI